MFRVGMSTVAVSLQGLFTSTQSGKFSRGSSSAQAMTGVRHVEVLMDGTHRDSRKCDGIKLPVRSAVGKRALCCFHLVKNSVFVPLLVLKGIYHYWKYVIFFPGDQEEKALFPHWAEEA